MCTQVFPNSQLYLAATHSFTDGANQQTIMGRSVDRLEVAGLKPASACLWLWDARAAQVPHLDSVAGMGG